mmetsp:Transcript_101216/g.321426  ORF Transcript_101216/g.321426 Transcript_101216/m.321426 type:complete len:234 (-) Transcript_101216:345-1046(-)
MRLRAVVMAGSSHRGRRHSASSRACSRLSFTPSRRTAATMKRRSGRVPLPAWRSSMNAFRNSSTRKRAVGTRRRLRASSAACRDQVTWQRRPVKASTCSGDGATVETWTFWRPMAMRSPSVSAVTAGSTPKRLARGSPMPMRTTFFTAGSPRSVAKRRACTTCASISSAARSRTMPIEAVRQKRQPWAQPTCELTHTVVVTLRFCSRPCGINTNSTANPSRRRRRNFVVVGPP